MISDSDSGLVYQIARTGILMVFDSDSGPTYQIARADVLVVFDSDSSSRIPDCQGCGNLMVFDSGSSPQIARAGALIIIFDSDFSPQIAWAVGLTDFESDSSFTCHGLDTSKRSQDNKHNKFILFLVLVRVV